MTCICIPVMPFSPSLPQNYFMKYLYFQRNKHLDINIDIYRRWGPNTCIPLSLMWVFRRSLCPCQVPRAASLLTFLGVLNSNLVILIIVFLLQKNIRECRMCGKYRKENNICKSKAFFQDFERLKAKSQRGDTAKR